jgi:hypothetical protein
LITQDQLRQTLSKMQAALDDPNVLVMGPRMSLVSARKPLG